MDHSDQIIEDYRRGDSEQRLHLFLSYAPLRNRFIEISTAAIPAEDGHRRPLRLRGWLNQLRGLMLF